MGIDQQTDARRVCRVPPQGESCPVTRGAASDRSGRRPTFREAMTEAEEQIFAEAYFPAADREIVRTVCRVMAEVFMMHPRALVRVDAEEREAGMVAEVFREIEPETVEGVIGKIRAGALKGVRAPRSYIRTMLYNAVFDADVKEFEEVREVFG